MRTILRNRIYLGEIVHKGKTYAGRHEAIVDEAAFVRVQLLLDANMRQQHKSRPNSRHDYLLTGLARCVCGRSLTTSAGTGRNGRPHRYYRCTTKTTRVDGVCEHKTMPPADRLETAVVASLRHVLKDGELLGMAAEEANEQAAARVEPLRKDLERKQRELARVNAKGRKVYERVKAEGMLGVPWAREELEALTRHREDLESAVSQAEAAIEAETNKRIEVARVEEALTDFDALWPNLTGPEAKELIGLLVREVRVRPDGIMDVDLYEGRTLRAAMAAKEKPRESRVKRPSAGFVPDSDWLRSTDSNRGPSG